MAADCEYTAELEAFDCYFDRMMNHLDPFTIQGRFIAAGLVDGGIIGGGVFLPNRERMEPLLTQVRSGIALNGPEKFRRLVQVLNDVSTYRNLASQLSNKCTELKNKPSGTTIDKSSTAKASHPIEQQMNVTGEQESGGDDDGETQPEGKKNKKKQSIYRPVISRRNPPCAIIINNQTFPSGSGLQERSWSKSDVDKIKTLEKEFEIKFIKHENLKAQQMKKILEDIFPSAADTHSTADAHSTYSGLLLFIMTHGGSGDMLYGSDGKQIALTELTEIFEAEKCPALKNKPKIFILQCCRGRDQELAHPESRGDASKSHTTYDIPQKADFLFVHSTTVGNVAYGHRKKGFITKLVDAFTENLNEHHLEDVLLIVKRQVADTVYKCEDGKDYKQMPSVVSQMRDKVWFDKE